MEIDHYIRLDFGSFIALVDAVGGVEISVPHQLIDPAYPKLDGGTIHVEFEPGKQTMTGERVLQYVRTRHSDSYFECAARQQQVIDTLVSKLKRPQIVKHWPCIWQIIRSETDTTLSTWDMLRFAPTLVIGWPNRKHRVLQPDKLTAMRADYRVPQYDILRPWITEPF